MGVRPGYTCPYTLHVGTGRDLWVWSACGMSVGVRVSVCSEHRQGPERE